MNTIYQIRNNFAYHLKDIYSVNEIFSIFNIICDEVLYISKIDAIFNQDLEVNSYQVKKLNDILTQLIDNKPIQYILGHTNFYGLKFNVDQNVLIPRQETEELVDLVLKNNSQVGKKIIDIGTGSGCIAVTLAKFTNYEIYAVDISEKAIEIAKQNAESNNCKVNFSIYNLLSENQPKFEDNSCIFDIIVSNPPYVRESEKEMMHKNVLDYEPHLALFVNDDDPLIFYRAIAEFGEKYLNKNGKIYLEINEYLGKETVKLFNHYCYKNVTLINDLSKKNRFLLIEK